MNNHNASNFRNNTMKKGTIAVITGDLVNSSQFQPAEIAELMQVLQKELSSYERTEASAGVKFDISRGDSFQGIVENPEQALSTALKIKAFINSYQKDRSRASNASPVTNARIAIGIGEANYDLDTINISNGQAFQLSGRTLDAMKAKDLGIALTTPDMDVNDEYKVHMKFLDSVTARWSVASAEVVYHLLGNQKEQLIADKLNRSQAAINHRKKAAGWDEIQLLLKRYHQTITLKFK